MFTIFPRGIIWLPLIPVSNQCSQRKQSGAVDQCAFSANEPCVYCIWLLITLRNQFGQRKLSGAVGSSGSDAMAFEGIAATTNGSNHQRRTNCFDDPVGRLSFTGFNYGHKADLSHFREDYPNRCTCAFVQAPCKAVSRSCSRFRHDFVGMCEAQTKVVFGPDEPLPHVYELTMADHPRFQLLQVVS